MGFGIGGLWFAPALEQFGQCVGPSCRGCRGSENPALVLGVGKVAGVGSSKGVGTAPAYGLEQDSAAKRDCGLSSWRTETSLTEMGMMASGNQGPALDTWSAGVR